MQTTFVILWHDSPQSPHYDFMITQGDTLATWQLSQSPQDIPVGQTVPAIKLPDHRLAYLDYEGPVSGDRGTVSRVDRGPVAIEYQADGTLTIKLDGARAGGCFRLCPDNADGDRWTLVRLSDS